MTTEEKLKTLILSRYNSIREFAISIDMPNTTLDSIFRRGIDNSSVSNIIKICRALNISADALADGEILTKGTYDFSPANNMSEVNEILNNTKNMLIHNKKITLDGSPINRAGVESIIDAIDVGVEIAKKKKRL